MVKGTSDTMVAAADGAERTGLAFDADGMLELAGRAGVRVAGGRVDLAGFDGGAVELAFSAVDVVEVGVL